MEGNYDGYKLIPERIFRDLKFKLIITKIKTFVSIY